MHTVLPDVEQFPANRVEIVTQLLFRYSHVICQQTEMSLEKDDILAGFFAGRLLTKITVLLEIINFQKEFGFLSRKRVTNFGGRPDIKFLRQL